MKNKLALIVSIVLGLIALYGVSQYISKRESQLKANTRTIRVAAAAERIPAGTGIEPKHLLREERNGQVVNLGIEVFEQAATSENIPVGDEDKLIGLKINRTVERGQPLLVSYFRQPVEQLANGLVPGERAITLHVDAITGIAGNLAPDSRVDIIGTFPLAAAPGAKASAGAAAGAAASHTRTLLTNVKIVALDNRTRDEDSAGAGNPRARSYTTVTVNVSPEEANLLIFAQQYGALTLALRPPADSKPATGPNEINEHNVLDLADQLEKTREENFKIKPVAPIIPQPAAPN